MNEVLIISSVALWIVLLLTVLLTLALVRRVNQIAQLAAKGAATEGLGKGEKAPDFQAETLRGEPVTLASYADRAVAFLFIGPQCGPCRDDLPNYLAWRQPALRAGLELVLVSNADAAETQAFATEFAIEMPILVAPRSSSEFLSDYKIHSTPSYCLIDAHGSVLSSDHPGHDWQHWAGISALTDTAKPPRARLVPSQG